MAETHEADPELSSPGGQQLPIALTVAIVSVAALLLMLGFLVFERARWFGQADEANIREWLDEARVYRKSVPDLVAELLRMHDRDGFGPLDGPVVVKRKEIADQFARLADPMRIYENQLPLFPTIYVMELSFPGTGWDPIIWRSPLPRPRGQAVQHIEFTPLRDEPRAVIRCVFRAHAFAAEQRAADAARVRQLWFLAIALILGALASLLAWRQERAKLRALRAAESTARAALEKEKRAADLEKVAAQQFARASVAAGSYAHNIKNLLVRPNDLLSRCLESGQVPQTQLAMLSEVRSTLGTVTDRLQQILQTVRREPGATEREEIDLNELIRTLADTWTELASEKWKLDLVIETSAGPLKIQGDRSHLTQMLENLIFNARDATYEYRSVLRDEARATTDPAQRQRLILESASWRGRVILRSRPGPVLEVEDNGIGMTDDVLRKCTETHFSTKRENALFEGLNAGSGLGLSFVTTVVESHGGRMQITSLPRAGATFRVTFSARGAGVQPE
ncbi:MAG: HAMP domain-containing histidine kinase [Gemmataceae bacterium]|nr:HAMP domain-containing histidine kinase [Gemmataceae bacterium]